MPKWHTILVNVANAETSIVETGESGKLELVKYKYGIKVPRSARRQALFFNDSVNVDKIERVCEALEGGSTKRVAADCACIPVEDLDYMMALGQAGHPFYGKLFEDVSSVRGRAARKLHRRVREHALSDEGVKDGTAIKALRAEEKDSWLEDQGGPAQTVNNTMQVILRTNFGNEVEVDHSEAEDAEFEECE